MQAKVAELVLAPSAGNYPGNSVAMEKGGVW